MKQLYCAVKGEVKYVHVRSEDVLDYAKAHSLYKDGENEVTQLYQFEDPTRITYIFPLVMPWLIKRELDAGMVLVGVDGESWMFAKPGNIVLSPQVEPRLQYSDDRLRHVMDEVKSFIETVEQKDLAWGIVREYSIPMFKNLIANYERNNL